LARGPGRSTPKPWPAYRAQLGPARALVAVVRGPWTWCRWPRPGGPGGPGPGARPWCPALVPGPGAGGRLVAQLVPGPRSWCRWPCLCLYVARSRVCMSRPARTNTQGRAAGTVAGGRGPRRLGRGRRFARPGAWAKARPPGGPKNGPGASCAGSSPFLHGQFHVKHF